MALNTPDMVPEEPKTLPKIWQWRAMAISKWALVIYFLIVLAQSVYGFIQNDRWPLWSSDYSIGSYPLLWFTYICLPLLMRDIWVAKRNRIPIPGYIRPWVLITVLISIPIFKWVYGWY